MHDTSSHHPFFALEQQTRSALAIESTLQHVKTYCASFWPGPLQKALHDIFKCAVQVESIVCTNPASDWLEQLNPQQQEAFAFVCGAQGHYGLCTIDTHLIRHAVHTLLGTQQVQQAEVGNLTQIEKGFLDFFAAKLLVTLQGQTPSSLLQQVRLIHTIKPTLGLESIFAATITVAGQSGYVQLWLQPECLFLLPSQTNYAKALSRVSAVKLPLSVELGQTQVLAAEWMHLSAGDIVMLENLHLHMDQGRLYGKVFGTLGSAQVGSFVGELSVLDTGIYQLLLSQLSYQEPSMEFETFEEEATSVHLQKSEEIGLALEEHNEPSSTLLNNVGASLVVELARLQLPLQAIVNLKEGDVLTLECKVNDPVKLVVSGKCIGQGELINVEGELGVRILSLLS